jgi:hypothetical protein
VGGMDGSYGGSHRATTPPHVRAGMRPAEATDEHSAACVFVVGPYKSGTSRLTSALEAHGLANPASSESRLERGYGTAVARYPTRESLCVRWLNQCCLREASRCRLFASTPIYSSSKLQLDILSFLSAMSLPVVIKDPLFIWTLPVWISSAEALGRRPYVFMTRRLHNLRESWERAPFTSSLLREDSSALVRMLAVGEQLATFLTGAGIAWSIVEYDSNPPIHRSRAGPGVLVADHPERHVVDEHQYGPGRGSACVLPEVARNASPYPGRAGTSDQWRVGLRVYSKRGYQPHS